jgi:hypothetical protein
VPEGELKIWSDPAFPKIPTVLLPFPPCKRTTTMSKTQTI